MNARQGLHIQATQPALVDDQHTTRTIAHLAGVGRRDQAAPLEQFDVLNALKRRLEANAFIDGMHILGKRTARVAYRHRQYFPLEPACLAGRCRALMALQGKTVQRFLVQAVLARHHFCAYELAEHGFAESTRNGRAMVVAKPRLLRKRTGTAHGHAGHGLDTGGNHHIHGPRHDRLRSKMNRLLRRSALPIDARARHRLGQLRRQHRIARHVARLLAHLADTSHEHIVDGARIGVDSVHQ